MRLSLVEFFRYLGSTIASRNVREGEEVLNANHLILCGSTKLSAKEVDIYALCLQTSALTAAPHIIQGSVELEPNISVIKMNCSCKAGAGGRCKHISAVLLHCTRYNIEELEPVSPTDVKCVWKFRKQSALQQYQPIPLLETECLKHNENVFNCLPDDESQKVLLELEEICPLSALAKHRAGRRELGEDGEILIILEKENYMHEILSNAAQSIIMMELFSIRCSPLNECCKVQYESLYSDDIHSIYIDTKICETEWQKQIKFRITGSRCYQIFTYKQFDWKKKSFNYFWPKSFTNKFVRHGIAQEGNARKKYIEITGNLVEETGFIVSSTNPWIGYSPDGIIIENGKPSKLLEIKCPFIGKSKPLMECLETIKCLDGFQSMILKKKHSYYAQIQVGMALLNLEECDLVIYASFDDSIHIINVRYDYEYCKNLLKKLKNNFFEHMLHEICENK